MTVFILDTNTCHILILRCKKYYERNFVNVQKKKKKKKHFFRISLLICAMLLRTFKNIYETEELL